MSLPCRRAALLALALALPATASL
ncbi:MAG: hypothetical protein JWP41_2803, partial [Ramlibacter sp.]|nr:hypothetical protein [Ramlibacter sp.]